MTDFIIAGAGIGGLSVAIALQKAGFSAKVYEVAPQLLPLGAGLSLSGNAIKAYDQIGLKDKVLAIGHKAKSGQLLTPKGKILSQFSLSISEEKYNYPAVAVHRGELQSLLVKELAPDSLFLGRKAFFFDQDVHAVTLNFIEGEPVKGAFLIDATGVNSYLRHEFHYHSKPRYSGYTCWRGVCDYKMEAHRDMLVTETWGWGDRIGLINLTGNRVYWFMVRNAPRHSAEMSSFDKEKMLDYFGWWHDPIAEVIEATPETAILWNDIVDIAPLKTWGAGRVTLLGDAAHATTPNMGQGACQSIEDAIIFAKAIEKYGAKETALRAYEKARIPRTTTITNRSWTMGKMAQLENPILAGMRNFAMRFTPSSVMDKQMDWLLNVDFAV